MGRTCMGGLLAVARSEIAMFGIVLKNYVISNRSKLIKLFLISGSISLVLRLIAPWVEIPKISSMVTSLGLHQGSNGQINTTSLIPLVFGISLLTLPPIPEQPLIVKHIHGANTLRFAGLILLIVHLGICNTYLIEGRSGAIIMLIPALVLLSLVGIKQVFNRETALVFCVWQITFWLFTIFDWTRFPTNGYGPYYNNITVGFSIALGVILAGLVVWRRTRAVAYSSCLALSAVIYLGSYVLAPAIGIKVFYVFAIVATIAFGIPQDPFTYYVDVIR